MPESNVLIAAGTRPLDLNEAQVRQGYVLPMISALGWDTEDPYEVYPEERAGGGFIDIRTQIVTGDSIIWEIKRPSVSLNLGTIEGREAAYQAVGYGRTFSHSPYCVVTNFESAHVLHSYSSPSRDRIVDNVVASFSWLDIEAGLADETLCLLTKEAVLNGASRAKFDSALKDKRVIRTRRPLEQRILKDLENWRVAIANEFYRLKPGPIDQVDKATQSVINRLLFIRCCEDRKLEREMVKPLISDPDSWRKLVESVFVHYRLSYNSDLFAVDPIADSVEVEFDTEILKTIFQQTFSGASADTHEIYDFSIVPLEVLGSAYEEYLAKRLRLENGRLLLETKPEVRKSGGVCYTPKFIVDEIIKQAVGTVELRGKKFLPKILDPACGSGTFLIQALRYLFDRNRIEPSKKSEQKLPLTLSERKEILEKCIFGADIDQRAVEITKLSLLLLLLEGTIEGILVKSALLPSLNKNIRCGNSLLSPVDALEKIPNANLAEIRPLDWETFKSEIGAAEGFDAVIGNPPYVRIQVLQEFFPKETAAYTSIYPSTAEGNVDLYIPFLERSLSLIKRSGNIGFIVPHRFWGNEYGRNIRSLIAQKQALSSVINFRAEQVFDGVTTYTCIVLLKNKKNKSFLYSEPQSKNGSAEKFITELNQDRQKNVTEELPSKILKEEIWLLAPGQVRERISVLEKSSLSLGDVIEKRSGMFQGLINGADDVYLLEKRDGQYFSAQLNKLVTLEPEFVFPVLKGSAALKRLQNPEVSQSLLYPYRLNAAGTARLVTLSELATCAPLTAAYILENESVLRHRPSLKTKKKREDDVAANPDRFRDPESPNKFKWFYDDDDFHKFVRNQALDCVRKPKLIVPSLFKDPAFFFDEDGSFALTGSGSGGGGAYAGYFKPEFLHIASGIIAILSSSVLSEWFERRGDLFAGYYTGVDESVLMNVPLPDVGNPANKHDIDVLGQLYKQSLALERTATDLRNEIARSIDSTTRRLFGL